jgi:hypothetical protein
MELARLRTSNGGLFITSFTVKGHESVIQKYVNAVSGFPVYEKSEIIECKKRKCTVNHKLSGKQC